MKTLTPQQFLNITNKNVIKLIYSNSFSSSENKEIVKLEGVVEDYKNHTHQVVEEKNKQDKALRDILEHLNKVMEEEGLTDKGLEHVRQQQKEILDELDTVKSNLDNILSSRNSKEDL